MYSTEVPGYSFDSFPSSLLQINPCQDPNGDFISAELACDGAAGEGSANPGAQEATHEGSGSSFRRAGLIKIMQP